MPPPDASPKQSLVLIANLSSSCKRTTSPGHWSGLMGIPQYASLTSCTAACEPGGRRCMRRQMTEKVPHVHGYWVELMELLMEVIARSGEWGEDKFWMSRNLPGRPGFSMMLNGEVWKGPRSDSASSRVTGLKYRSFWSLVCIRRSNSAWCWVMDD